MSVLLVEKTVLSVMLPLVPLVILDSVQLSEDTPVLLVLVLVLV
jgi:hypothetical protein